VIVSGSSSSVHRLARLLGSWDEGGGTKGDKLATNILRLIIDGHLAAGSRLPSERHLATTMGIARTTVGHAFSLLRDEGVISSSTGVGTFVTASGQSASARGDARLQSFIETVPSGTIDLRSAALLPLPMVFDEFQRLSDHDFGTLANTHGYLADGLNELRCAIADYYERDGLRTRPEQIVVTAGAQQAIHISLSSILNAGDVVVVEEPTFRGGLETLRASGARLVSVPSGAGGLDVAAFRSVIERTRARVALLLSTVHNPTGSTLSNERRRDVGQVADHFGVTLIDDTSNCDLFISPERPAPLASFTSRTITVGSASKLFWGGLRVGWIRAESELLHAILSAKNTHDLGTSVPSQLVTSHLLARYQEARGQRRMQMLEGHVRKRRLLEAQLPDWVVGPSTGGASLWVKLPAGRSSTLFAERARRAGVNVLAGPTFSTNNACDDHVRIATSVDAATFETAVQRLAEVWQKAKGALQ
jgi:DNA-binding transcriptional MocR family regulator